MCSNARLHNAQKRDSELYPPREAPPVAPEKQSRPGP